MWLNVRMAMMCSLILAPVGVGGNCNSNHGHIDTDMGSCRLEKIEVLQRRVSPLACIAQQTDIDVISCCAMK
jgi:hypothetical protein